MSHTASAQPETSFSVTSGCAEVAKSRSLSRRPSIASRTGPPTSASSSPASAKSAPSSSMTDPDAGQLGADAALDLDDRERGRGGVGHDGPVYAATPGGSASEQLESVRAPLVVVPRCPGGVPDGRDSPAWVRQAPAAAAPAEEGDPLVVHLDTIDPVLPRSGDVVITGTRSPTSARTPTPGSTCTRSPRRSRSSTRLNLVNSAASDPTQAVGERVHDAGHLLHRGRAGSRRDGVLLRHRAGRPPRDGPEAWRASTGSASTPSVTAPSRATRSPTGVPAPSSRRDRARALGGGVGRPVGPQPRLVHRRRQGRRARPVGAATRGGRQPRRRARHGGVGRRYAVQLARRPGRARRADPAGAGQPGAQHRPGPQHPGPAADRHRDRDALAVALARAERGSRVRPPGGWDTLAPPTSPTADPTAQEVALADVGVRLAQPLPRPGRHPAGADPPLRRPRRLGRGPQRPLAPRPGRGPQHRGDARAAAAVAAGGGARPTTC